MTKLWFHSKKFYEELAAIILRLVILQILKTTTTHHLPRHQLPSRVSHRPRPTPCCASICSPPPAIPSTRAGRSSAAPCSSPSCCATSSAYRTATCPTS